MIEELDIKTTDVLRNMCKHHPPFAQLICKDKKADLIYKRVFCDFISSTRVCTSYTVLQHLVSMANFSDIVNGADFDAESTSERPTQLNDMLENFGNNCVRA